MTRAEYAEEIKRIEEQNNVELEIYPMAVDIIGPTLKNWSKRYVFARKRTARGQIYYGLSSFPDVAILDRSFRNMPNEEISAEDWEKLKGCLEVKSLGKKLITKEEIETVLNEKTQTLISDEMGQLLGEVLWYKKVIYTNGIEWRFLHVDEYKDELRKSMINTVNERIKAENTPSSEEFIWWKHLRESDVKIADFKIRDECITKNCLSNWDNFIAEINSIDWA